MRFVNHLVERLIRLIRLALANVPAAVYADEVAAMRPAG